MHEDAVISPAYSTDTLLQVLEAMPDSEGLLIAYSGGLDSRVLLESLAALQAKLSTKIKAVHVNHGLSQYAADWAVHCRDVCDTLGVPLEVIEIDARHPPGESPEAWARQQRYTALADVLGVNETLLTAHHMDDQVETLMLQLFRGAGPDGLAAMPAVQQFGRGWHCRPLLAFCRRDLQLYARDRDLNWVEDESNQDTGFDRNYIRHHLLPVIRENWPGVVATLTRAAQHQAEASDLLKQLAERDLAELGGKESGSILCISALREMPLNRQKNLLRYWLHCKQTPTPDANTLQHIISDVINSKYDATPCVSWSGVALRRYRQHIYLTGSLDEHDAKRVINWELDRQLTITLGKLTASRARGNGIKACLCRNNRAEIRYRQGGETIRPSGRAHHHDLKKLLQECGVPPWLRDRIPLLYIDGRLAAVPGKWIAAEFMGTDAEECWQLSWEGMTEIFPP